MSEIVGFIHLHNTWLRVGRVHQFLGLDLGASTK